MADGQGDYDLRRSGGDAVGESIPHMEGQHSGLTGNAQHVGQRNHDRHNSGGLTGAGGNEEVHQGIDDKHTDFRNISV